MRFFGWPEIARIGVVQASIGAVVVLTTSTLNRVMVVELAMPAVLPGALVAIHYFIQMTRPRFGHGSDLGGRRTPWILGGMAVLCCGGVLASAAAALMTQSAVAGVALATLAFLMIGAGVGACGTSLLVLLAAGTEPRRRAAAATLTWIMMIAAFAITAGTVGAWLDPFSFTRLIVLTAIVAGLAMLATSLAIAGLERRISFAPQAAAAAHEPETASPRFRVALREVLSESSTRRFAGFVFISMLAYSAQDLVLEPFAGAVFDLTPGQSTQLGGLQHSGVLLGMLLVAVVGTMMGDGKLRVLRLCMLLGCLCSAVFLGLLAVAGFSGPPWPLHPTVFALGVANGAFSVAAIGAMMGLVSRGHQRRDGMRMGVWGAAQAMAFGLGGIIGTLAVDVVRWVSGSTSVAYALVFCGQAALFALAAWLAASIRNESTGVPVNRQPGESGLGARLSSRLGNSHETVSPHQAGA